MILKAKAISFVNGVKYKYSDEELQILKEYFKQFKKGNDIPKNIEELLMKSYGSKKSDPIREQLYNIGILSYLDLNIDNNEIYWIIEIDGTKIITF